MSLVDPDSSQLVIIATHILARPFLGSGNPPCTARSLSVRHWPGLSIQWMLPKVASSTVLIKNTKTLSHMDGYTSCMEAS